MAILQTQYEYDVVQVATKLIPEFHFILITDKKGDITSYHCSEKCMYTHKLSDLIETAKLFSNRLRFGEYNEALGKFQSSTLTFGNYHLIGRKISNEKILMISISKDHGNLEATINKVLTILKTSNLNEAEQLIELKEKLKPIPPLPIDIQREKERLITKKYVLVASPYEKK